MKHKLEVDSIMLDFGLRQILTNVYLKCETGSISGLLGKNGEGKTCLMNIIYGSLPASGKSVRFDGTSIPQVFKKANLLTYLPQFNFTPVFLSLKRIFADYNLMYNEFENHFPEFIKRENTIIKNLSGGERRLIEVYVIIKSKSQFTMLDEPFSHLMPLQIEKIIEILKTEKMHKGFLITDHLYQNVLAICDDIYLLAEGKINLAKSLDDIKALKYIPFN